jgi:hypothetical protein
VSMADAVRIIIVASTIDCLDHRNRTLAQSYM